MTLELVTIPCLSDNYAYLLHEKRTNETILVDAPEAAPIIQVLEPRGWKLTDILITHHHSDHIDGVEELRDRYDPRVVGALRDTARLPKLNLALSEGDAFAACGEEVLVMEVDGHTIGHIAFYLPKSGYLFSGDSLMSGGCGRLFEGTPAQMWASLQKLRALPDRTIVCSGHEYTVSNLKFALELENDNRHVVARLHEAIKLRDENVPTVPVALSVEKATNPFLRCDDERFKSAIGQSHAAAADVFREVRTRKDNF